MRHRVRVLHDHTGSSDGGCNEWDGRIGLFLNTYSEGLHHETLAADGTRKGSGCRWVHIGCNTVDCQFDAIVNVSWIEERIEQALRNTP